MEKEYRVGQQVYKSGGDYRFSGAIVAVFQKLSGLTRYVVEDERGILHIFNGNQLKLNDGFYAL